ncbi:MAG: hypothetical protein R3C59_07780 [Planctomycetaceae bacterium]
MVTDGRVKELRRLLGIGRTLADSARMAEMSEKTFASATGVHSGRGIFVSARTYRTRSDSFQDVWDDVRERLEVEPRLKAKTLFEWLQDRHQGARFHTKGQSLGIHWAPQASDSVSSHLMNALKITAKSSRDDRTAIALLAHGVRLLPPT